MEVEIKVPVRNLGAIEEKIREMGASFLREVKEIDTYYNHPCRDFSVTDEAIRIRNDGTLTYKGPKVDKMTKSREEINLKIEDIKEGDKILRVLGFKPVMKVTKIRKYYKLGEITISLDDVEALGKFVEIECIGEYKYCREKVLHLAQQLNLKKFERRSYLEMLLEKGGK